MEWLVESFRLTAFTNAPEGKLKRWENLVGISPDEVHENRKAGLQIEAGLFQNAGLVLQIQGIRWDWFWVPPPVEETKTEDSDILHIGPFSERIKPFETLSHSWLEGVACVNRVAFGAILLAPVKSQVEGYEQLNKLLSRVDLDPHNMSDFLFQINRTCTSKILDGIVLNRLRKWSVIAKTDALLQGSEKELKKTASMTSFACRLELDINTGPIQDDAIPSDKLKELYSELIELGSKISMQGDVS